MASFQANEEKLSELLDELEKGRIQLPDFQRGWVWDDERIRKLLASIGRSFPIGAVMMLKTGGDARFQPRTVQGAEFAIGTTAPQPERLLLDGQQRLTSLYQSLSLHRAVETVNSKNQKIKRWYYVDMRKALQEPEQLFDAIIGVPEEKIQIGFGKQIVYDFSTPEKEYEMCVFPVQFLLDGDDDWREGFSEHWNYDKEKQQLFKEFRKQVIAAFVSYQVPVISLDKQTSKEAVCQVFENVNQGGVSLSVFELVTATYAADNFNLRDDWYGSTERGVIGRCHRFSKHEVLKGVQNTDFLQCVALLATLERRMADLDSGKKIEEAAGISCKRSTILNLPLESFKNCSEAATKGFESVAQFLHLQYFFGVRDLPYQTQLIPLAAILAKLGERWKQNSIREKLSQWFWCGIFGELYGSAIETRFARDLLEVLSWIDGGPLPGTVYDANFSPDRLLTLRTRGSAAYKGLYALLMRDGGLDLVTGLGISDNTYFGNGIDIHHIFPKSWCEKQGISPSIYNSAINKTALSWQTNTIIGGAAPSHYVKRLQHKYGIDQERMEIFLKSHLINPTHLENDDFYGFFEARKLQIISRLEAAMGKRILMSMATEPVQETNNDDEAA